MSVTVNQKIFIARYNGTGNLTLNLTNAPWLSNVVKIIRPSTNTGTNTRQSFSGGFGGATIGGAVNTLVPGLAYEFTVGVFNGWVLPNFTLVPGVLIPLSRVENVVLTPAFVESNNTYTFALSWTGVQNNNGYEVQLSSNPAFSGTPRTETVAAGATSFSLTNITLGGDTYTRVRAVGTGIYANGDWSNGVLLTSISPTPFNVAVSSVTTTSVTLQLTNYYPFTTSYSIYYSLSANGVYTAGTSLSIQTYTGSTVTLTQADLSPGTVYYFRVRREDGLDGSIRSRYSSSISATTDNAAPVLTEYSLTAERWHDNAVFTPAPGGGNRTDPFARVLFKLPTGVTSFSFSAKRTSPFDGYSQVGIRANGLPFSEVPVPLSSTFNWYQVNDIPAGANIELVGGFVERIPGQDYTGVFTDKIRLVGTPLFVTKSAPVHSVTIIGDSIPTGGNASVYTENAWPMQIRNNLPAGYALTCHTYSANSFNDHFSGGTFSTTWINEIVNSLNGTSSKRLVIALGTNDAGLNGISVADFKSRYGIFVDLIHAQVPDAIIDCVAPSVRTSMDITPYQNAVLELLTTRAWLLAVVPTWINTTLLEDGLHFTTQGHTVFAQNYLSRIGAPGGSGWIPTNGLVILPSGRYEVEGTYNGQSITTGNVPGWTQTNGGNAPLESANNAAFISPNTVAYFEFNFRGTGFSFEHLRFPSINISYTIRTNNGTEVLHLVPGGVQESFSERYRSPDLPFGVYTVRVREGRPEDFGFADVIVIRNT